MDVAWYVAAMCLVWACAGVVANYLTTGRPLDLAAALAAAFFAGVALTIGITTTMGTARTIKVAAQKESDGHEG